jgi:hypothetical protein
MLSVPKLPLRLHSLAASRTGSKRLVREDEEVEDVTEGTCAGTTGEPSPPPAPPPRDVEGEIRVEEE